MNRKRKLQDDDQVNSNHENSHDEISNSEVWDSQIICNDTDAAILFIKNTLIPTQEVKYPFPPVVFVHQLYDVIKNRTTVNRQIVRNFIVPVIILDYNSTTSLKY